MLHVGVKVPFSPSGEVQAAFFCWIGCWTLNYVLFFFNLFANLELLSRLHERLLAGGSIYNISPNFYLNPNLAYE